MATFLTELNRARVLAGMEPMNEAKAGLTLSAFIKLLKSAGFTNIQHEPRSGQIFGELGRFTVFGEILDGNNIEYVSKNTGEYPSFHEEDSISNPTSQQVTNFLSTFKKSMNEAKEALRKFIIVHEGHWDDEDDKGEFSMLDIYVVQASEVSDLDLEYDDDEREKFIKKLESGKIGKKSGKGRVFNPYPDLGLEGVKGPKGVELLFPER